MGFDLKRFRDFCADDAATIVARACGDASRTHVFACHHELAHQPLGEDELVLKRLDPETRRAFAPLYSEHASAALFIVDFEPALYLAPPSEWESLAAEVDEWWRDAADEMEDDERALLEAAVVFARVPSAATYFLMPQAGTRRGKVVMFCHDGLELITLADSLGDFLTAIPESAIRWVQGDVRYVPGEPRDQFYPIAYRPRGVERASQKVVRIWIESEGHAEASRFVLRETTPSGMQITSPAGIAYDLVVELYPTDEASISIRGDEGRYLYVRGHGDMRALGKLAASDVANAQVETEPG